MYEKVESKAFEELDIGRVARSQGKDGHGNGRCNRDPGDGRTRRHPVTGGFGRWNGGGDEVGTATQIDALRRLKVV